MEYQCEEEADVYQREIFQIDRLREGEAYI
jgi:hypothetical protein